MQRSIMLFGLPLKLKSHMCLITMYTFEIFPARRQNELRLMEEKTYSMVSLIGFLKVDALIPR
jgi:hypothetical protein